MPWPGTNDDDAHSPASNNPHTPPIVGIGASRPAAREAFQNALANRLRDGGMSFVRVQHLDSEHDSVLFCS